MICKWEGIELRIAALWLEEPREEAAALQMLSLQTILLNYSGKGSSIPVNQKKLYWQRPAI